MSTVDLAVQTIKTLSMDAVEAAQSGHPGMPMGMADAATVLWTKFLKFNPDAPQWPDRDRFVLSAGHGSMLLYSLLHLSGYPEMTMAELKRFRQWGSRTAGHPEFGEAGGIETTTGPLGQGISNAVGMALAERLIAGRVNTDGAKLVDHYTYAIAGDGDLMEGVSYEAASLAGHLKLGKLIVLYDDNKITIDGTTEIAFTEDVAARFNAFGWHTAKVDGHSHDEVEAAISAAQSEQGRPSIICCRTHIGHGSPNKQDTSGAHGAPLGADEIRLTKEGMNWPHEPTFRVPDSVRSFFGEAAQRGRQKHAEWTANAKGTTAAQQRWLMSTPPTPASPEIFETLDLFERGSKIATRKASGAVLNALKHTLPELIGGSADLAGSNNTDLKDFGDVTADEMGADRRNIRYGVREHGMGAIMNGMSLHGGLRPYAGTFLVFSDYMRPSVRLAALMGQPVVYVFTHDSVFLGEDGPTHQPIEHAMSLRLIPNLHVLRPGDGEETIAAWHHALQRNDGPSALLLTRQGLPILETSDRTKAMKGGYILRRESGDTPRAILMATGSELHLAAGAAEQLSDDIRVVSMPCFEAFEAQSQEYRDEVLPPAVTARVAIEAGQTIGWERYVGTQGAIHGIQRFGTSAPAGRIAKEWGFTVEAFSNFVAHYLDRHSSI